MARRIVWIILVLAVALRLALAVPKANLTTDYARQIMRSAKVAEMKAMLNPHVEPCDDFYEYACGSWHHHNPALFLGIPYTNTFQMLSQGFHRRLNHLLESKNEKPKSAAEKNLEIFYESCLKASRDDANYNLALLNIRKEYIGSDFSWWRSVARIQNSFAKDIILSVQVMPDLRNNTLTSVYLSPAEISPLSESRIQRMWEESQMAKELEHILALHANAAKETAAKFNEFEQRLLEGAQSYKECPEKGTILHNVSALQQLCGPHLNLKEFLELTLGTDNVPEQVYVYNIGYISYALGVIRDTGTSTLAMYVTWKILQEFMVDEKQTTQRCIEQSRIHFEMLTDYLVYQEYRSPKVEAEILELWEDIRGIFRHQLKGDKLDWISNGTRQLAVEKLDRMKLFINSYDKETLENIYGNLTLDSNKYEHNVKELLLTLARRSHQRNDGQPIGSSGLSSYTPIYSHTNNSISIPVALLQPSYFWGSNYPQALKYGTLGYLIAHEMIHGFDDSGNNFDAHGNLAPWWDTKSLYEFEEKRKCFQAQYHQFKYGSERLPLRMEQSENIADNAAVKLAYTAYQRWLQQQNDQVLQQETFAGLKLDNRQLFFLSVAQVLCNDVESGLKTSLVSSDKHAPNMYRVIGSLSNFQEFSWVFNCSQNASMDPEYKCAIF